MLSYAFKPVFAGGSSAYCECQEAAENAGKGARPKVICGKD